MLLTLGKKTPRKKPQEREPAAPLSALEIEVISFFVQQVRLLGQPGAFAEVYGLLFISPRPLTKDDLIGRLSLSDYSGWRVLRALCDLGMVRRVFFPQDEQVYYEPVVELRHVTEFLRERVLAQMGNGQARLKRVAALVRDLPAAERARVGARVTLLQSWEEKSRQFLPTLVEILGN